MAYTRIALSVTVCLVFAAALSAAEPECATNYHADGKSAETFVLTSLTPQAVIERLPRQLASEGVAMYTSQPDKGTLNADGLDVRAEMEGDVTRVTFHSSVSANSALLCRYAGLVGNPPKPHKALPVQDSAAIARIKHELLRARTIIQPNGAGSDVTFKSPDDFLEFAITDSTDLADGKRRYEVSMLLPRSICNISSEDAEDGGTIFIGKKPKPRTKPVRVEASLIFAREGETWELTDSAITKIASTK